MLELEEVAALMYEISKDNEWRMGRRGHYVTKRNVFGYDLEVRHKDYKWSLFKKNCWNYSMNALKTKHWMFDDHEIVPGETVAKTVILPTVMSKKVIFTSRFMDTKFDLSEVYEGAFDSDGVILKLFLSSVIDEYKEFCHKYSR